MSTWQNFCDFNFTVKMSFAIKEALMAFFRTFVTTLKDCWTLFFFASVLLHKTQRLLSTRNLSIMSTWQNFFYYYFTVKRVAQFFAWFGTFVSTLECFTAHFVAYARRRSFLPVFTLECVQMIACKCFRDYCSANVIIFTCMALFTACMLTF